MSRTKGSFSLAGAIEPLASAPLDARGKVATKADLTAEGSFPYPYIGMETYVEAENKKYRLIGNDHTNLANWQEVGTGGGSGDTNSVELTQAEYDELTEEEKNNGTIYFITNAPNGSDIQLSVMPTASYSYANMIVQYVGATTQTYTNGYFYKCVEDGGNYSWNPCPTQEGGSGGTTDYEGLDNKPSIEDVTLSGNKTAGDLGLQKSTLESAITLGGNEVTNLESALSILARLATISKITDNSFGGNSSSNFNKVDYSSTGNFKAYSYKWSAGSSLPYTTGVPQWFTYPSYDVYYLFLTFRGTDDTFIDEFAWCFYTESSVAKVRHFARRATKSGSTWTFPAWTEVGSLPVATSSVLGGVKIGENMTIEDGVINPSYLVIANKFNKSDLYSTTEKVVGCWTDGKPLYQKTFTVTTPTASTDGSEVANYYTIGSSIDTVVKLTGSLNSSGAYIPLDKIASATSKNTDTASSHVHANKYVALAVFNNSHATTANRNKLRVTNTNTGYSGLTCYVTIQYTKTTDSADSFKYADENDYSTSEKIVGTWIGGKPIYQRTLDLTSKTLATGRNEFDLTSYLGSSLSRIWLISDMSTVRQGSTEITPSLAAWSSTFVVSSYTAQSLFVFMNGTKPYLVFQQTKTDATSLGYITIRYTKA